MRSETSYIRCMSYMGCIGYMSYIGPLSKTEVADCYG
jgi:hypothetical protein